MGGIRWEVGWFFAVAHTVIVILQAALFLPHGPSPFVWNAALSTAGSALFWVGTLVALRVIREPDGRPLRRLGVANRLTLVRFLLIAPIVGLIVWDRFFLWIGAYVLCLLTDILDGIIARRRNERSEFGVIMDPLADIVSTAAVFAVFFGNGWVPGWVFAVLMVRYGSLFAGALILLVWAQPLYFKPTPAGKIVGVLQALAAILIGILAWSGGGALHRFGEIIYPFLGVIFASVIVSQGVIGIRHVRKGTANA